MVVYNITGDVGSADFHRLKVASEALSQKAEFKFNEMNPFCWAIYRQDEELPSECSFVVEVDGRKITSIDEFLRLLKVKYEYQDIRPSALFKAMGNAALKDYMNTSKNSFIHIDVKIGNDEPETIVLELFSKICPKTCKNFEALCSNKEGDLTYLGTIFHRVVKNAWIQGGDTSGKGGDGGSSIYGETFADENFIVEHDRPGIVGMANKSGKPHTNGSQFYITLRATPFLDRACVAFGRVFDGYSTIRKISNVETENQRPLQEVLVVKCGILNASEWTKTRLHQNPQQRSRISSGTESFLT